MRSSAWAGVLSVLALLIGTGRDTDLHTRGGYFNQVSPLVGRRHAEEAFPRLWRGLELGSVVAGGSSRSVAGIPGLCVDSLGWAGRE